MSRKYTIHVYEDPGHGWFRVPFSLVTQLGIEDRITTWSYRPD